MMLTRRRRMHQVTGREVACSIHFHCASCDCNEYRSWSCHDTDKILRLHCLAREHSFVTTTSTKMMMMMMMMMMMTRRRRMHQVTGRDAACSIHFHCASCDCNEYRSWSCHDTDKILRLHCLAREPH